MIIFTPAELRSLAAASRAEAEEIQKGPISMLACNAVFDANTLAERYERNADALEVAVAECDRKTIGDVATLTAQAETSQNAMNYAETAWNKAFADRGVYKSDDLLTAYHDARKTHHVAVAKLLIATGKVK